ncbi:hypothetical protein PLICRDRAFT_115357 [Plicaturopsis crispa FD-325 SS-3]|nr:hypothetical protein PLICRDRAFT_115357 [Plicaturopsis crispa FD-325 SS-3]
MISGHAIATLVLFIVSIVFVIQTVSFSLPLPHFGRKTVSINLTTAPILAIAILWATKCLGPQEIRAGIVGTDGIKPYNILILFSSLAYMAITLDITGVLQAAAFWVSNRGGSNGRKLYLYFYVMLTVLSIFLGNDPVILSGTAFLVYYTEVGELSPMPWLMSEFAAANTASMVLFVGNPTNVVICEGFGINNAAFTAYTILPFLGCNLACYMALATQFHDTKYIPGRLSIAPGLDVRAALLDGVGAWVGTFLLGSCLVVIIVVSFFNVDVWMISLPFAVAKFLFDLTWDHYKYTHGMPMLGRGQPAEDDLVLAELDRRRTSTSPQRRQASLPTITDDATKQVPSPTRAEGATDDTNQASTSPSRTPFTHRFASLAARFPTFFTALPRLPFALIPFAFSQFILIEGLVHQGWIEVFARWLAIASKGELFSTVWLVGVLGVILCNISGTNIGATILLTKVVRAAELPDDVARAAGIALAVASNIGAVSFTFSASLAGLLWRAILKQKGIIVHQKTFAFWNILPLSAMTAVGLAIVSAEMAVLY